MQDLRIAGREDLDAIVSRVVDTASSGAILPPDAALLLVRLYVDGRDDLADALGGALALALDAASFTTGVLESARWLTLFVAAAPVAADDRVGQTARDLSDRLRGGWPCEATTADGFAACAASLEACLCASRIADAIAIVPPAIDELERIVAGAYRPGEGVFSGHFAAHVSCAAALLTAFEVTGRLPYSMLAEELIQPALRATDVDLPAGCAAARVLCRLAALHRDRDYRAAAVVTPGADYGNDAARILQSYAPTARAAPLADAALYALALGELISLR